MLGDVRKEIIANTLDFCSVSRVFPFSLNLDYVHELDYMTKQPGVYQTNFLYTIRYAPRTTFKKFDTKPFMLKIDFYDTIKIGCHRFKSFEAFCNDEDFKHTIPFLLKYTDLSQELFDLAKANPYCELAIGVRFLDYVKDVKTKYKEEHSGEEIENFTFLSPEMVLANQYMNEDKIASREASKNRKVKGVVKI